MVRDDDLAWDVQQETYLRAWGNLDKLRDPDALTPWLRRIAVNVTITELAQQKALTFTELAGEDGREPIVPDPREEHQPELALDRKEVSRQVREIVGGLSREQQVVIGMFYFEGLSIQEIADLLQVTPGTVKTQLHRGRKGVERAVLVLKKRGVSLCGLTPLSYLTALLHRLEPEPKISRKALAAVLEKAPVSTATITAVTASRALFHSIWTRLAAVILAASLLAGVKYAYDAVRRVSAPEIGDVRPPASDTAAPEEERETLAVLRQTTEPELLDLEERRLARPTEPSEPGEPEPTEPSKQSSPEPSEQPANSPAPDQPDTEDHPPAPSASEPTEASESENLEPTEPSEEPPDETGEEVPIIDSGTWGENLTWTLDENGKLTFSGSGEMAASHGVYPLNIHMDIDRDGYHRYDDLITSVSLPEGLISIGDHAFSGCKNLTSLVIPEGVTSIGDSAVCDCVKLTSVSIPDSVVSIGEGAFAGSGLTCISLPGSLLSIGGKTFLDCESLASVVLPNRLVSIEYFAFSNCDSLTSVVLPDSLDYLGFYAFSDCENLRFVSMPNHDIQIGGGVFSDCPNLSSITADPANPYFCCDEAGVLFSRSGDELVLCPPYITGNYTISAGVITVRDYAFWDCKKLTSLTFPDGVQVIGNEAFYDCTALMSLTIPESVVTIGDSAFWGCDQLTIYAPPGSYAEQYARENGIPWEPVPAQD